MRNEIISIISDVNPRLTIQSNDDLERPLREIGIDSLDTMSLLLAIEDRHGVSIPEELINGELTIAQIIRLLERDRLMK